MSEGSKNVNEVLRWVDAGEFVAAVTYRAPIVEPGSLPALIVLVREGEGR